jgi:hypothetical protein
LGIKKRKDKDNIATKKIYALIPVIVLLAILSAAAAFSVVNNSGFKAVFLPANWAYTDVIAGSSAEFISFGSIPEYEIRTEIVDAEGTPLPAQIEFTKSESGKKFAVNGQTATVKRGQYDIKVVPEGQPVKRISIKKANIETDLSDFIRLDDVPEEKGPVDALEVYAIDPTALNFTEATVTATAKGSELWKCKSWDFEARECKPICELDEETGEEVCHSGWQKLMDIMPGEDYSFTLTPEDPAYAELTVQSCAAEDNAAQGSFAGACDGTYPAACPADLLSCNDNFVETHSMTSTGYAGLKISLYNSSVTDKKHNKCGSLLRVVDCFCSRSNKLRHIC